MTPEAEVARILVTGADKALGGLLEEWLAEEGCRVVDHDPDLVIADLPLSKEAGARLLREHAARHAGKPLVALSSNVFAGVEANGAVARAWAWRPCCPSGRCVIDSARFDAKIKMKRAA